MNELFYFAYSKKFAETLRKMEILYDEHYDNIKIKDYYINNNLDPDSQAVRFEFGVPCSADGLHSISRICNMETSIEDVIKVYKEYRKYPIFFFPKGTKDILGINRKRSVVFGDRIDHTLYDIKMYYTKDRNACKLLEEFEKGNTKIWLDKMESFENIIDWYGVKGIFTDDNYNVYDLETSGETINSYKDLYSHDWTIEYYNNLKNKISIFYDKYNI